MRCGPSERYRNSEHQRLRVGSDAVRNTCLCRGARQHPPRSTLNARCGKKSTLDQLRPRLSVGYSGSSTLRTAAANVPSVGPGLPLKSGNRINTVLAASRRRLFSGAWRSLGYGVEYESVYRMPFFTVTARRLPELDPEYRYRDALLLTLLDMERSGLATSGSPDIPSHLRMKPLLTPQSTPPDCG
jgi:hypothetical protein